jgi:DNA-binding response OmpR family regulator
MSVAVRQRVLVVEDDPKTARWLELYLRRAGFDVDVADSATRALAALDESPPHLVLLDVMLPGADGFRISQTIRELSRIPVIFVTARTAEEDRLLGFALGADDYISKPFSPREVVARVKAVLRRTHELETAAAESRVAGVVLRTDALSVTFGTRQIRLTPIEARLLAVFMSAPGRVWTRSALVDRVLGVGYEGTERTVDAHVKNLRRKLEQLGAGTAAPVRIATTHGVGYHLATE